MPFEPITYDELNARQKEAFNFQKVSAVLADYGFTTIRLSNDWCGADFIAQHLDGVTFFKVQLKGRPGFDKKYCGKEIHICFPKNDGWFMYPHDELLQKALAEKKIGHTDVWKKKGIYHFPDPISGWLSGLLQPYRLKAEKARGITSE